MNKLPVYDIEDFESMSEVLYANTFQDHIKKHPFVNRPHKHNFFLCVFFTKGSGTHEIDFNEYKIKPGTLFILKPGQFHRWDPTPKTEGFIFFHSKALYNKHYSAKKIEHFPFYTQFNIKHAFEISKGESPFLEGLFAKIVEEFDLKKPSFEDAVLSLIDLIYITLVRKSFPTGLGAKIHSPHYMQMLDKLEQLIEKKFTTLKSPSEYAELMNISEKHLNRICKESLGKSLQQIISERIVLEAKRMLSSSAAPVAQIAESLGYTDISYFTRVFKKSNGVSPKIFRMQALGIHTED